MTIHQIPNTASLDAFWMPFTANRQFKAEPRLIASAEGMHYTTVDGRKVIDGSAGLWCVNAGHGRREIADAVQRQLMALDYAPSFQIGHPLAFDFAEKLVRASGPQEIASLQQEFLRTQMENFTRQMRELGDTASRKRS